jgi:hypothetical protein
MWFWRDVLWMIMSNVSLTWLKRSTHVCMYACMYVCMLWLGSVWGIMSNTSLAWLSWFMYLCMQVCSGVHMFHLCVHVCEHVWSVYILTEAYFACLSVHLCLCLQMLYYAYLPVLLDAIPDRIDRWSTTLAVLIVRFLQSLEQVVIVILIRFALVLLLAPEFRLRHVTQMRYFSLHALN